MKIQLPGILVLATLCSATLLQPVLAQNSDAGFKRPDRNAAAQHGPQRGKPGPQKGQADRQHRPGNGPENLDVDGDGLISLEEFTEARLAHLDDHFSRMDSDGDGLLSLDERTPAARPERPDRPAPPEIDREAVLACVRETIADYEPQLDQDTEDRFDNADSNADGFLDLAEVSAAMAERASSMFARLDADGDGFVSKPELADHHAMQLSVRRVVRNCIKAQLPQR